MTPVEWVIAGATLLGPVLAVQAQKWIERARERRTLKRNVFWTLMATRAARLASNHVQALNSIELAFYGHRLFGGRRFQTKAEGRVVACWRDYFSHLNAPAPPGAGNSASWVGRADELFLNLLQALADEARFAITRQQLSQGHYSPVAHGTAELENQALRQTALRVFSGESAIRVDARIAKEDADGGGPAESPAR